MFPTTETRTGTRMVCKLVPTTETRTVIRDCGHWGPQIVKAPSDGGVSRCGGGAVAFSPATRTICKRVWVPNVVTQEVQATVNHPVREEVDYSCDVTVCNPETRAKTVKVYNYKDEERARTKKAPSYQNREQTRTTKVCSCKTETRSRSFTACKMEQQTRSRKVDYSVCVPQTKTRTCNIITEQLSRGRKNGQLYRMRTRAG